MRQLILDCGAAVAQVTVNHLVVGSNPTNPAINTGIIMTNCIDCNIELTEDNTFNRKDKSKKRNKCKKCENKERVTITQKRKIEAIEYKGGKCEICGYDHFYGALEFHHKNPSEKEADWSTMKKWSFERTKKELDKCMCVCANCHREIHNRIYIESVP